MLQCLHTLTYSSMERSFASCRVYSCGMYVSSCVHQWVKSSQSCGSYLSSSVFQVESRDDIYLCYMICVHQKESLTCHHVFINEKCHFKVAVSIEQGMWG